MPKRSFDPLGRNHQIERRPTNRTSVDSVCNYILEHEYDDFHRGDQAPSSRHVYYDAYLVIFGTEAASIMLRDARDAWLKRNNEQTSFGPGIDPNYEMPEG